jgi:hypothetical protein
MNAALPFECVSAALIAALMQWPQVAPGSRHDHGMQMVVDAGCMSRRHQTLQLELQQP